MRVKIINQPERVNARLLRKLRAINHPRQVRGGDNLADDWAGNAEARRIDLRRMLLHEQLQYLMQILVLTAGVNLFQNQSEFISGLGKSGGFEQRDPGMGYSDIAGQDHSGM